MTPVPIPGCLMPLMPSSTPSPGPRMLQIQLSNHQEIILETVVCLIAPISCLMTTMDIPHNTPAIALPRPQRKCQHMRCIQQDKGLGQASKVLRQDWNNMKALPVLPTPLHPLTIPKNTRRGCRLMYKSLLFCNKITVHREYIYIQDYKSINLCLLSKYVQIASSAWHVVSFLNQ